MAGRGDPDVVVVGGGPAGCATALWAAQRGLRTHLVHRPDREAYRPGETLHPGIEPLFRQLGAEQALLGQGFPRHAGHAVEWGKSTGFQAYGADQAGPWHGFHACRQTLDRGLRAAVRAAGVDVTETARVAPLVTPQGAVAGVRHVSGITRARVVVDAAGSGHWLARSLGLELRRCSPRLVARYGLVGDDPPGRGMAPSLTADANGWTWIARVGDRKLAWVRLPLCAAHSPGADIPAEIAHLPPHARGGADVTWRWVPAAAGPGYLLVGDAAFVLDPLSSHGVLHALMSGMMAAEMIAKTLLGGVPASVTAAAYRRWSSTWFSADVVRLRELYSQLPHPPPWVSDRPDTGSVRELRNRALSIPAAR